MSLERIARAVAMSGVMWKSRTQEPSHVGTQGRGTGRVSSVCNQVGTCIIGHHPTPEETSATHAAEMLFIDPAECIDCDACV